MKQKLTLYVDKLLIELAKQQKINISQLLEETLSDHLGYEKKWVRRTKRG